MINIISLLYLFILSQLEELLGINWDYHPDAVYYIENSKNIAYGLNYENIANNFYYYIVDVFGANITSLILLNSILYIVTNSIILKKYLEKNTNCTKIEKIIILFMIFSPYRAHLAIHVLKDTLIIFLFTLVVLGVLRYKLIGFILLLLTRVASVIYFIFFVIKKINLKLIIFIIPLFVIAFPQINVNDLLDVQSVDMRFRDFDNTPNFMDLGFIGGLLRFMIWPILLITGGFIFYMPSFLALPIAFSSFLIQIWSLVKYNKLYFNIPIIISIGVFAFLVTGFTSFIRYTLPLVTLIPVISDEK